MGAPPMSSVYAPRPCTNYCDVYRSRYVSVYWTPPYSEAGDYARCVPRHAAPQENSKDINLTLSASQERLSKRLFRQVGRGKCKIYIQNNISEGQICEFLPDDLLQNCLVKIAPYEELFRMKPVSKPMKQCIESELFQSFRGRALPREGILTAVHFTRNEGGVWQGRGFDLLVNKWRRLPPLLISSQAADSSSQASYLIAGGGGLLCFLSVSSSSADRSATVWNPCTQKSRSLPALRLSWKPRLLHLISDLKTMSYQVIVAGYSSMEGVSFISAVIYDYDFHMDRNYE